MVDLVAIVTQFISLCMSVPLGTSGEPGVLPRTLDVIFNSIKGHHFESLYIKPKFHSEATYLNDTEQENELAIKETLLKVNHLSHTFNITYYSMINQSLAILVVVSKLLVNYVASS